LVLLQEYITMHGPQNVYSSFSWNKTAREWN